ncbi:MAG: YceK/YidQ family lipoprotein [Candidatus Thiodiazotropha sp.]
MALLLSLSAGCSTVKVHFYDHHILHPYLGTETAVKEFIRSFSDYYLYGQPILMAMDVPFCFAADTLLLPYDLIIKIRRQQKMTSG